MFSPLQDYLELTSYELPPFLKFRGGSGLGNGVDVFHRRCLNSSGVSASSTVMWPPSHPGGALFRFDKYSRSVFRRNRPFDDAEFNCTARTASASASWNSPIWHFAAARFENRVSFPGSTAMARVRYSTDLKNYLVMKASLANLSWSLRGT